MFETLNIAAPARLLGFVGLTSLLKYFIYPNEEMAQHRSPRKSLQLNRANTPITVDGPMQDVNCANLEIHPTTRPLPRCPDEQLGFGKVISDHMLKIEWRNGLGWSNPQIIPSGPIALHPFAHVFHYANECYEGMKAYIDANGNVRMFRPEKNMERLNFSASRLCLPAFNGEELLKCIEALLKVDKEWIPRKKGYAMYLRPLIFSTTPWLGLTQTSEAHLYVMMSPVGPYFKSGFVPIKLAVDSKWIRAWPGGTGNVKFGGNYSPTVMAQRDAANSGASQALFVYDKEQYITEAGTMNIFLLWKNKMGEKELVTPTLEDGTILAGITRQSVIDLAREWGECKVTERMLPLQEVLDAFNRTEVYEIFGTGTAAVIQPISSISYNGIDYSVPKNAFSENAFQVRMTNTLIGIQYGEIEHPWSRVVA